MGLKDFFEKGKEEPVKPNPQANQPAPAPQPQQQQPDAAADTYTVKSGDSLSKIAKRFYGNEKDWNKIFEANKDQIKNPDLIYPGQTFKIPKA